MKILELVPKDKGDVETAERLKNYSFSEIEPVIPELLTWIQDMNWPVAGPVSEYLESISCHITDHIVEILRGHDEMWKYWCISVFGQDQIEPKLMSEIKRIALHPTKAEIDCEVHEVALQAIERTK